MATAVTTDGTAATEDGSEIAASSHSAADLPESATDSAADSSIRNLEIPTPTAEMATTSGESASSEDSSSEIPSATATTTTSSPLEASSAASSSGSSPPSAPATTDDHLEKMETTTTSLLPPPPPSSSLSETVEGSGEGDAGLEGSASATDPGGTTAAPSSSCKDDDDAAVEDGDDDDDDDQSVYQIKWAKFHSTETLAIVTQNENGPCPLLAIVNVLLLRGKLKISAGTSIITYSQLMSLLWDCILTQTPQHISAGDRLNYEKNMNDALAVIHKLQTGLDVNVKFTGVSDFEYTIESIIFDLLNISLYHGWLVDPQSPETEAALGSYSYNQIVERIISNKASPKPELVTEALIAEEFLENTKSQLSYHGICELHNTLKEGELAVFFRNNHFSTIYKLKEELFLLVTDQGFVSEPNVMWETLANVEGDSHFVDQDFNTYTPSTNIVHPTSTAPPPPTTTTTTSTTSPSNAVAVAAPVNAVDEQKQIDADLLVALTIQDEMDKAAAAAAAVAVTSSQNEHRVAADGLPTDSQELADRQLAMALQQEEERLEAARNSREGAGEPAGAAGSPAGGSATTTRGPRSQPSSPGGDDGDGRGQARRPRGQEKDKDCVIL